MPVSNEAADILDKALVSVIKIPVSLCSNSSIYSMTASMGLTFKILLTTNSLTNLHLKPHLDIIVGNANFNTLAVQHQHPHHLRSRISRYQMKSILGLH